MNLIMNIRWSHDCLSLQWESTHQKDGTFLCIEVMDSTRFNVVFQHQQHMVENTNMMVTIQVCYMILIH